LVDLQAQYRRLKPEIDAAIQRVLDRAEFILGPEVKALERELAAYCQTAHAVAVASGTDALELALRACRVGPGNEVITSAFSFFASAETIATLGVRPVFVDIDPVTYTIDPALIERAVTTRTKAIVPVHLFGHPCDMDAILPIARAHRLKIIEDCAQAIGASVGQRRVGSFGDAGALSFYPSKNLGAYGDGGMVVTTDASIAERVRLLRYHGSRDRVIHETIATNSRLDELQAAILRVKLPYLEAWIQARRRHAQTYRRLLVQAGLDELIVPQERPGARHVFHLLVIRCPKRDALYERLVNQGVGVQIHYSLALPFEPAFASLGYKPGQFPAAERVAREVLSLPLYPELAPELIETVVSHLQGVLRAGLVQQSV